MSINQTFLGGAFERMAGVDDWEKMFGGRESAGQMCEFCPAANACIDADGHRQRCGAKTLLGVMAVCAITKGPAFQIILAELLRVAIADLKKQKERVVVEQASARADGGPPTS